MEKVSDLSMQNKTEGHAENTKTTSQVKALYEAYPYPSAFSNDSRKGVGLPSHLPAIDHYIYGGKRNFTKEFRVLVAGCGTGDALIDLGKQVQHAGIPARFLAIDLSDASLEIARKRADAIGINTVEFENRKLQDLDPKRDGQFDYIDCCGVLHHLDSPEAGLESLVACLTPEGGIGLMLYGELGRTGVYDAQRIIRLLVNIDTVNSAEIKKARNILQNLPRRNRLKINPQFTQSDDFADGEIADIFLHPMDRAYRIPDVRQLLEKSKLDTVEFIPAFRYNPALMLPNDETRERAKDLPWWEQRELAELLSGSLRKHAFYAKHQSQNACLALEASIDMIPCPVQPMFSDILALWVSGDTKVQLNLSADGLETFVSFTITDEEIAIMREVDGRRTLEEIWRKLLPRSSWETFKTGFEPIQHQFTAIGALFLSETKFS